MELKTEEDYRAYGIELCKAIYWAINNVESCKPIKHIHGLVEPKDFIEILYDSENIYVTTMWVAEILYMYRRHQYPSKNWKWKYHDILRSNISKALITVGIGKPHIYPNGYGVLPWFYRDHCKYRYIKLNLKELEEISNTNNEVKVMSIKTKEELTWLGNEVRDAISFCVSNAPFPCRKVEDSKVIGTISSDDVLSDGEYIYITSKTLYKMLAKYREHKFGTYNVPVETTNEINKSLNEIGIVDTSIGSDGRVIVAQMCIKGTRLRHVKVKIAELAISDEANSVEEIPEDLKDNVKESVAEEVSTDAESVASDEVNSVEEIPEDLKDNVKESVAEEASIDADKAIVYTNDDYTDIIFENFTPELASNLVHATLKKFGDSVLSASDVSFDKIKEKYNAIDYKECDYNYNSFIRAIGASLDVLKNYYYDANDDSITDNLKDCVTSNPIEFASIIAQIIMIEPGIYFHMRDELIKRDHDNDWTNYRYFYRSECGHIKNAIETWLSENPEFEIISIKDSEICINPNTGKVDERYLVTYGSKK